MIHVARDGVQIAEVTEKELRMLMRERGILGTDHCWKEGMLDWKSVEDYLVGPPPPPVPAGGIRKIHWHERPESLWIGLVLIGCEFVRSIYSFSELITMPHQFFTMEIIIDRIRWTTLPILSVVLVLIVKYGANCKWYRATWIGLLAIPLILKLQEDTAWAIALFLR